MRSGSASSGSDTSLQLTLEVAKTLGVSRQRVLQLVGTEGFPEPIAVLSMGKVWSGEDVRDFAKTYKPRKPG